MIRHAIHSAAGFPILAISALLIQTGIDAVLGDSARYYNAWHVVLAVKLWLAGGDPLTMHMFLGQEQTGDSAFRFALFLFFVQPVIFGAIALRIARLLVRPN